MLQPRIVVCRLPKAYCVSGGLADVSCFVLLYMDMTNSNLKEFKNRNGKTTEDKYRLVRTFVNSSYIVFADFPFLNVTTQRHSIIKRKEA